MTRAAPPLDLCLEPELVSEVPKLSTSVPQLVHRQVQGGRLRMVLPPALPDQLAPSGTPPPSNYGTGGAWRLHAVAQVADRPMVLQEPIFIDPAGSRQAHARPERGPHRERPRRLPSGSTSRAASGAPCFADGASPPDSPLSAILNASGMVVVDSDDVILSDRRIQDQVLRTVRPGVVIHRILTAGLPDRNFLFVASPFFALEPISVPQKFAVHASTSSLPSIDPMLRAPAAPAAP